MNLEQLYLNRIPETGQNGHYPEIIRNEALGITGINDFWGDKYDVEKLHDSMEALTGQEIHPTGFKTVFRSSHEKSYAELSNEEFDTATRAVGKLLEVNKWEPESISCFSLGSGSPQVEDYGRSIAEANGIRNAAILNTYGACNSATEALKRVFVPEYHGKRVIVAGVEGLTRYAPGFNFDNGSPYSHLIFGNGLSLVSFTPGESLKYLVGQTHFAEDTNGYLAAKAPYDVKGSEMVEMDGNTMKVRVPKPLQGVVYMNNAETAKMFIRLGLRIINGTRKEYAQATGVENLRDIKSSSIHHPNFKLHQAFAETLDKFGIDAPFVVEESNSSAATFLIAFARNMKQLKPGERHLCLGIGAGAWGTGMVLEAGQAR